MSLQVQTAAPPSEVQGVFAAQAADPEDPHYSARQDIEAGNSVLGQFLSGEVDSATMTPAQDAQMLRELEFLEAEAPSIMDAVASGELNMSELGHNQSHMLFFELGNSFSNAGMHEHLRNFAEQNPFGLERMKGLLEQASNTFTARTADGARFNLKSRVGSQPEAEPGHKAVDMEGLTGQSLDGIDLS